MLEHRMDEWEQEWFRQGREEGVRRGREEGIRRGREEGIRYGPARAGRAEERALLRRLAGAAVRRGTRPRLWGRLLEGVDDADRLAEIGEMVVDCRTGGELLDRAGCA